jgi:hypothetical protein
MPDCSSSQFSIPESKLGLLAQAMGGSEALMCPERMPGVRCDKPCECWIGLWFGYSN